jgi:hypothetical protein
MEKFSTEETPAYLRAVEGLPPELADLAEQSETRQLKRSERRLLDREIKAACRRVLAARLKRDGKV